MKLIFNSLLILVVLLVTSCTHQTDKKAVVNKQPNFVVVFIDDMGYGDIGTQGATGWTTPNLDKMASEGMRFTNFYSAQPVCSASRAGLLTGCYPNRIGISGALFPHDKKGINPNETTIAEMLKEKGYATAIFGKWHLGLTYRRRNGSEADGWSDADLTQPLANCPLDHGFDFFFGMSRSHGTSGPNGDKSNTPDQTRGPGWIDGRKIAGATTNGKQLDGSYRLDEVGDMLDRHAMAFLQSA
ncbi:MAG: sulfatase-like hydrolase/transferase, partial [Draconibacterium sp.]|nr:sulfatase-like hydrolase/transferase [Draconibacterium sp.]